MGKIINGYLDDRYGQIFVSTDEHVVASLSAETGAIVWRQVLEKSERGEIKLLHLLNDEATNANSVRLNNRDEDAGLITVSGTNVVLVRGWNVHSGNLAWEWSVTPTTNPPNSEPYWFYEQSYLYSVVPNWSGSHVVLTAYNAKTGQEINQSGARKIPIKSIQKENCDFIKSYLVCVINNEIIATDLKTGDTKSLGQSSTQPRVVDVSNAIYIYSFSYELKTHIISLLSFYTGQRTININ